jgi:crotonobetainyl-CoA:carnitine CoA-transferase CaiB-like acyl-CoA transferase
VPATPSLPDTPAWPSDFFRGLKVVEFAAVLAGPAVGLFFAELGAEVLKIENRRTGGDMTRGWKAAGEPTDRAWSAYFCSVNWGKTHLLLDLDDPTDRAHALDLARQADVVISNFKPSSSRRMGMDADALRADNQRLVFAQVQSFADTDDDAPAFDIVLQAETGFLHMNGTPDGPPVRMPVALIDALAAHQLKEAILLALLRRATTGLGCTVSTSLEESALASLLNQAANYLNLGMVPQRMGTLHPNIAPYGETFGTADGHAVLLAVGTERQFAQLCSQVLRRPDLLQHVDFQNNAARVQHRDALRGYLAAAIGEWPIGDFLTECRRHGVPAARIRDMAAVFESPVAQAMILEEKMPDGTHTQRVRTNAFKMSC